MAATEKKVTWSSFDRYIRRAVRAALDSSNARTRAAVEERREWERNWNLKCAADAERKAKRTTSKGWRARFLSVANDRRERAAAERSEFSRYAWPERANQTLVYPEVHNSHVTDCVHVRVFDNRGVPVVRMSLTGSASFIEEMARFATRTVATYEAEGVLDVPDAKTYNEPEMPVEAYLG